VRTWPPPVQARCAPALPGAGRAGLCQPSSLCPPCASPPAEGQFPGTGPLEGSALNSPAPGGRASSSPDQRQGPEGPAPPQSRQGVISRAQHSLVADPGIENTV